jgi:hypothetical protein
MLNAKGLAQVTITKEGRVSIKTQFTRLDGPTKFGNEISSVHFVGDKSPRPAS